VVEGLKYLDTPFSPTAKQTRGVSHCGLAIYIKKYFKARKVLHAIGGRFGS
jgi:hypothetical protein